MMGVKSGRGAPRWSLYQAIGIAKVDCYHYSPAVSGVRQPCTQVQFLAWGHSLFGPVEVPLSRVCHVGLETVHVVNNASV